ncbi:MAG: S-layer homology domain-containing protein [Chloroflexota bacterium]|nr:S-layer homology domain-containing protein [Chloroflexota bacterium]
MKRIVVALSAVVLVLIIARASTSEMLPTSQVAAQARPAAPQINLTNPETKHAVSFDVSPPLSSIPPAAPVSSNKQEYERENWMKPGSQVPNYVGVDPVVQHAFGGAAMPTPILTFKGYTQHDNADTGLLIVWPPDTEGDVGLNHYFQWNNIGFKIFDKAGNLVYGPVPGNTLFQGMTGPAGDACSGTNSGDPIVLFDTMANRWLASQFTTFNVPSGPTYECIAISKTDDPTGQYYRYAFLASPTTNPTYFEDYPHFGVWPDAYYMTTNEFNINPVNAGAVFVGAGNFAFEREKMLAGDPAARMIYFHLNPPYGGFLPSDMDGPTPPPAGSPNYFIAVDDEFGANAEDLLSIFKFHVDWSNVANSTFTGPVEVPVAEFDPDLCTATREACIPQPNTTQKLETISDRLMFRLAYRNFGTHESLVVNHTVDASGTGQAGVRWYELRSPNTIPTIYQQGTYAPDANHRWMGSMAMDGDGNMALGYSVSNATDLFPSIRYTGRLADDPLGQMSQGEASMYEGLGSQVDPEGDLARWGDYSMMGIDPVDDCTFWYTQEYYPTTGTYWNTRIGKFRFESCGGGAIPTETPIPAPNPCTLPGHIVEEDGLGDTGVGNVDTNQDKYDIEFISVAEPYTGTGPNHLVFTLKVASLDGPENDPSTSPNSYWRIVFTKPPTTTLGFVDMRTDASGNVTFKYGTGTSTVVGDADFGTYTRDGHIRITVATSKLGLTTGDTLSQIYARVSNGAIIIDNANYPEPDRSVTYTIRGNAACQFGGGATPTPIVVPTACPIQFADVPAAGQGSTFYTWVRCLACRQIVSGYPCGGPGEPCNGSSQPYYRPGANVTRGQLSKIIANAAGLVEVPAPDQQQFADVEPGDPFYLFVERLAQTGAVEGYPCGGPGEPCTTPNRPYFRPNNPATRGQISKIVSIAAGYEEDIPAEQQTFTDTPSNSPFWVYIERLAGRGIISGYGSAAQCPTGTPCFRYNDFTTRGQMAKIAANAFFPDCETPARAAP